MFYITVSLFNILLEIISIFMSDLSLFIGDVLHGIVLVRLQLCCSSPVEWAYYAATNTRKDICCYCAEENTERDKELLKEYRVVLPICAQCRGSGQPTLKRLPLKK